MKIENFEIEKNLIFFIFHTFSYTQKNDFFEIFSISKLLVSRFQNALTFFIINRFGRDFFQSYVDFHAGGNGAGFRPFGASRVVPQKNAGSDFLAKKLPLFLRFVRPQTQLTTSLPYITYFAPKARNSKFIYNICDFHIHHF